MPFLSLRPQHRSRGKHLGSLEGDAMDTRRIAAGALVWTLLCSCHLSGGPEDQASKQESPIQANNAAEKIKEISTSQLKGWMTTGQTFTLIDVREDNEWQAGHAASAMHISRWRLSSKIGMVVPDKAAPVVLYCQGGVRSAAAAETLQKMGYTNVFSLTGGLKSYQLAGLPLQK